MSWSEWPSGLEELKYLPKEDNQGPKVWSGDDQYQSTYLSKEENENQQKTLHVTLRMAHFCPYPTCSSSQHAPCTLKSISPLPWWYQIS